MQRHVSRALAVAIVGLACAGLPKAQPVASPPMSAPAGTAAPVRFLVVADRESTLAASTAGRFARVAVNLGDSVRAGQLLAAFDCGEVQARRDAARAELEAARVQYEA
ncbi:MAG: hypothetical protein DI563_29920, partial [Variovorax paradoxus]